MTVVSKDIQFSHALLNFLLASCVGQDVFFSVLKQVGSTLLDDTYLEKVKTAVEKLQPILDDFKKAMPFVSPSWNAPETFEASTAMTILGEVKEELKVQLFKVEAAIVSQDLTTDREAVQVLIAALARTANTRRSHWQGMTFYADLFKIEGMKQGIERELKEAEEAVRISHAVFDTFKGPELPAADIYEKLRWEAEISPLMMRAQIHESLVLLQIFNPKASFEEFEILPNEIPYWTKYKIPAVDAGYWRAFRFTPDECMAWNSVRVSSPLGAALWRRSDFNFEQAEGWVALGFPPQVARAWYDAGYDPRQSLEFVEKGIFDPQQASKRSQITDEKLDQEFDN